MKHTPGPWHRDGFNLSSIIRLKYPKGHSECRHVTGTYETIARCEGDNWAGNSCAIAVLPELLEALESLTNYIHDNQNEIEWAEHQTLINLMDNAIAVIAQANGESI